MSVDMTMDLGCDADDRAFQMLIESDDTFMPIPHLNMEPQLLISKVRKHYFEYVIKLLSHNYEKNQKLLGKNIYLPSAIWRCAKFIEMRAAQACMLVHLYRKHIVHVVKELKTDTENGKLYKKLFEYLKTPPINDKKTQTNQGIINHQSRTKRRRSSKEKSLANSTLQHIDKKQHAVVEIQQKVNECFNIPVILTTKEKPLQTAPNVQNKNVNFYNTANTYKVPLSLQNNEIQKMLVNGSNLGNPQIDMEKFGEVISNNINTFDQSTNTLTCAKKLTENQTRMSLESQDSVEDQVMLQLEQLFKTDTNEADDLFEGILFDNVDIQHPYSENNLDNTQKHIEPPKTLEKDITTPIDEHSAKIKSLDERLALLESSGVLEVKAPEKEESPKPKKPIRTKWMCELYFQKLHLCEKLDEICEQNRKKHSRIKRKFIELFGDDTDDEQIMSPLDESRDFVLSCKERIAPWIVKYLMPFYSRGRIKSKLLFKALAKHLLKLIIDCNQYPDEYEVYMFVTDFVKCRPTIRCEADFKKLLY